MCILFVKFQDNDDGGGRWNDMIRLHHINGSAVGVEKFMFATASAMGDHASWTLRAQLQEEWRQLALKYQHYNVTIFQVGIQFLMIFCLMICLIYLHNRRNESISL